MGVGRQAEVSDPDRVAAVAATDLLDTEPEEPFESLARIATVVLGAPIALLTLVDGRRSFLKSAVGLADGLAAEREIPVDTALCRHVVATGAPVALHEVDAEDSHSLGVTAWIGVPIVSSEGQVLGAFSVADTAPRRWQGHDVTLLEVLAGAVSNEIALRQRRVTQEELRLALAAGNMGTWVWDKTTGKVSRDSGLGAIYGLDPDSIAGTFDDWVAMVHPDDRRMVLDAVDRAMAEGGTYTLEHRIVRPDGRVRWVERRGQSFFDETGQPAGSRGLVVDVTARKEAEAERDRLLAAEQAARRAAEEAAQRLAYLQAVTAGLAEARTADEVAKVIVAGGTAGLRADSGALCRLSEADAMVDVVRQVGYDTESIERFQRFPFSADLPAGDAMRSGHVVLLRSLEERDERYPKLRGLPARNQSFAVVPLLVGRGPVGALALGWAEPREFSDNDVHFLMALGQHAAQALDRAQFYEAEHEAAERQAFLAAASGVLGSSLDYRQTLVELARLAVHDIADSCSIHLVEDERLKAVAQAHVEPAKEELMRRLTAHPSYPRTPPLLRVLDTAEPVLLASVDDEMLARLAGDAEHLQTLVGLGVRSAMAVPLRAQDRTLGVLVLAMADSGRRFGSEDLPFVEDLAARIAAAIANSRSHRVRTEVARTLQASLLPPRVPLLPGLEVAARYHPIGDGSEVGGDFYDVFSVGDGCWGVVIGDVSGKGVRAASLTALARYTVRTAARRDRVPSSVLAVLNDAILEQDVAERFATIAFAVIHHTAAGVEVTLSRAGHPPPLLVRPAGGVVPLGRSGTAVGLFGEPAVFDDTHVLRRGEVVVFYTDGLLEARSPEGAFAEGLLDATLAGLAGEPAEVIADAVEEALLGFQGGRPRDDMAFLVLRQPPGIFHHHLARDPADVSRMRVRLREWLARQGPNVADVADTVVLAASELTTNAFRAARGSVQVHAWSDAGRLTVDVQDDGKGFDGQVPAESNPMPDPWSMSGRGLFLVRTMMDETIVQSGPSATLVRTIKRL